MKAKRLLPLPGPLATSRGLPSPPCPPMGWDGPLLVPRDCAARSRSAPTKIDQFTVANWCHSSQHTSVRNMAASFVETGAAAPNLQLAAVQKVGPAQSSQGPVTVWKEAAMKKGSSRRRLPVVWGLSSASQCGAYLRPVSDPPRPSCRSSSQSSPCAAFVPRAGRVGGSACRRPCGTRTRMQRRTAGPPPGMRKATHPLTPTRAAPHRLPQLQPRPPKRRSP